MERFENKPLAVVGMACRMPGANDLEEFWALLEQGRCTEAEIPAERFNRELYYDPNKGVLCKSYASIACMMDYEDIDPGRTPLAQEDIDSSDISHLTICEVAADACRHAGFDPWHMSERNAGVYIGHVKGSELGGEICFANQIDQVAEYVRGVDEIDVLTGGKTEHLIRKLIAGVREDRKEKLGRTNLHLGAHRGAGLISKMLDLNGPYMVVNAACASSLQALAMGARALQLGQIDMAIIGGASYCKFDSLVLFSRAQSVSATGTRPFDADADGLVNGEGYAAILVKTLDRALADKNQIHAVIRGIGMSTDGRGKSLWAPRKEGQIEAIQRAYGSQLDMSRLQYVEAHATSTQVGDHTELISLAEALDGKLPAGTKIPIGSVKGNVGHTIETSGMAGLLKTILSMKHGTVPPAVNVNKLNPKVDWDNSPFFVPREPIEWPRPADGHPRRAAVNSFGIGGLNVHVVLDDYVPAAAGGAAPRRSSGEAPANQPEPIAIIGMGAVLPGARTLEAYWDLLHSGNNSTSDLPPGRWNANVACGGSNAFIKVPHVHGGFIHDFEYDWKKHKIPPKQIASADPLQFMVLDAVDQAMRMSGYDQKPFDRKRTGVCVGAVSSGEYHESLQMGLRLPEIKKRLSDQLRSYGVADEQVEQVVSQYSQLLIAHMPAIIDETGSYTTNTLVSRITKSYDLMGGGAAVDSGSTSAASALTTCINTLHAGDCDMVICAAGHRAMGFLAFQWHAHHGLLPSDVPFSPFDNRADGYVPGEGAGVVVLKRHSDAVRDGDTIYGLIHGFAVARSSSLCDSMHRSITESHSAADISPGHVAYVEMAACGLSDMDAQEVQAVQQVFAASRRQQPLPVGTLASQIGHVGGASAVAALLKTVHALEKIEAPANVNLQQPNGALAEHNQLLLAHANRAPLSTGSADGRLLAGVSAVGDEQLTYHFVVERGTKVAMTSPPVLDVPTAEEAATAAPQTSPRVSVSGPAQQPAGWLGDIGSFRIVRIGAASMTDLVQRVTKLSESPEQAAALFAQSNEVFFGANDRIRTAIVVENENEFYQKCRLVAPLLLSPKSQAVREEKGVFCHELLDRQRRVAFLFPGHGSQYAGMLQSLVEKFRPAAAAMQHINAILADWDFDSFEEVAWKRGDTLGVDVWQTQLALLAADTIVLCSLRALGIHPDRVAGHSFGEFPALLAGGAWTFEAAARATHARCMAIEGARDAQGIMLSVAARSELVERLWDGLKNQLTISVRNARDQIVVAGAKSAVLQLDERLKQEGVVTRVLAAPRPFHTPLMQPTKAPFAKALAAIHVEPPAVPVLSSVTNRYVAEPHEIRENLVEQMTRPVHYAELIERLAAEGTDVLVEVGPHQILTKLHRHNLAEQQLVLIGSDQPKRSGLRQLLHVRACLECAGAIDRAGRFEVSRMFASSKAASSAQPLDTAAPEARGGQTVERVVPNSVPSSTASTSTVHHAPQPHMIPPTVIMLGGSPYEIGLQHGREQARQIQTLLRHYADLAGMKWHRIPDVSRAATEAEQFFAPEDLTELQGIADGAGVAVENVIAHNLMLYPDMGAGCSHFAITSQANGPGGMLHGANEDLPLALSVHDCLVRIVQVRHPRDGIAHVTLGVAGQLAGINGVNAQGLTVSSTMLLDLPRRAETAHGRSHSAIVRMILQSSEDIESAIEIARQQSGIGGWSMCISQAGANRLGLVEYDGKTVKVQLDQPRVLGTNHTQLHEAVASTPSHSKHRLNRLKQMVGESSQDPVNVQRAQEVLRDRYDMARNRETPHPTMNTIRRVDNQISIVVQPTAGKAWVTQPSPPRTTGAATDHFFELNLAELLASPGGPAEPTREPPLRTASDHPDSLITGNLASAALRQMGVGPSGDSGDDVCYRYVLRTVAVDPPTTQSLSLNGPVLILGNNDVATALRRRLEQFGVQVAVLPQSEDVEQVLAAVDDQWQLAPAPHLLLTTPHDKDAVTAIDRSTWERRRTLGVTLPFFVCQRWCQRLIESGLLEQASVMAATRLGGDFGFSRSVCGAEGGALAGLVKSLKIELGLKTKGKFRARIVDVDHDLSADQVVDALCHELADSSTEPEVGYAHGQRVVVRPVAAPLRENDFSGDHAIPRGGTWVVTGGARGVTAVVARELGRRFGLKLHLVGSSPIPQINDSWRDMSHEQTKSLRAAVMKEAVANREVPVVAWSRVEKAIEIDRNLREFHEDGIQFNYHPCDVTDRAALAQVLQIVRQADGPIDGILHGAGFESALRFEKKKPELVERTVAVKVDGAAALMELTWQDPLQSFIAFGSVSGRFGGLGQADYGMANDLLSKLVSWYREQRPDCLATCFHWHAWDEVGMAVRPESRHLRDIGGITYMPTTEGVAHLVNELLAGAPEREVLITGWPFHKLNPDYASKIGGAAGGKASATRDRGRATPVPVPSPTPAKTKVPAFSPAPRIAVSKAPLIESFSVTDNNDRMTAEIRLDPTSDPFLTQHLFKGRPILPAVISIAAVAQAADIWGNGEQSVAALRNVELLEPMKFHTDRIETVRVCGEIKQEGIACELVSDFRNRAGKLVQPNRAYMRAEVDLSERPQNISASVPPLYSDLFTEFCYPDNVVLYHGEVFRALVAVEVEGANAWGRIKALDTRQLGGHREGNNWIVPSAAIDAAFYTCGVHVRDHVPGVAKIPKSIDRMELGRFPRVGEELLAWVSCREIDDRHAVFDFTIYGDDGSVIVQVKGYHGVFIPRKEGG